MREVRLAILIPSLLLLLALISSSLLFVAEQDVAPRTIVAMHATLFGGLMIAVAIAVAVLLHRLVSQRVASMGAISRRLAAGDYDARLNVKGRDELAGLARAFDLMAERIATDHRTLKETEAALRRLNRELLAISNCNQVLIRAEDESSLLNNVCRTICNEAGYCMVWVGYADADARNIRPVACAGAEGGDLLREAGIAWTDAEQGNNPGVIAIRSGESVCIQDFATDLEAAPWQTEALQRGYRSGIALPLKDESATAFGVLTIYSTEPHAFTPDEKRLMEELAGDLAFGINVMRTRIERKRAEGMAQARLRILETAYSTGINLDNMLRLILDEIVAQTGSTIGFYHFLEEDQETLWLQNWSTNTLATMCTAEGKGSHYSVSEAGVWVDCVRERRPVIHNDYATLPHRKGLPPGHAPIVRELVVPISRGNQIVAVIGVGNKPIDYDGSDVQNVLLLGDFSWEFVTRQRAEGELSRLNEQLEQRVQLRTAELEEMNRELDSMNKLFVGRELRMIELKERIAMLEKLLDGGA